MMGPGGRNWGTAYPYDPGGALCPNGPDEPKNAQIAEEIDHATHPPNQGNDGKGNPCPPNDGSGAPPLKCNPCK